MKYFAGIFFIFHILFLTAAAPEAALILLNDREYVTVNADGTSTSTDECVYRILNYKGLKQLQTLRFHFNSTYSTFQVTHLAIIKSDGRRITVDPEKNSAVSTESSQLSSAIFDPANKVMTVTVPGLEIGDTLEVTTVEKEIKTRLPGEFSDIAVMQADFPIEKYEYTIDMPAGKPLYYCLKDEVPGTMTFSKTEKGQRTIYSWQARNVPAAVPEVAMPPMYTCTQRILTSTVKSWEDISRWYDRLCAPHLAKVNDAMKNKTAELISGKKSDMEKITALFQFVSQQIRYTGVTAEDDAPGYEPHDVDQTFNQKHGVCRDKAALLTAMLRLAGFKSYPVLFMSGSPKDKEIANIYFNHAIVAVEKDDGQYILMDPTFETTTELFPGYLAGDPFLVAKPQGETLRTAPPVKAENNLLQVNTAAGKDSAEMEIKFSGIYDNMYRSAFSEWTPENIHAFFAGVLNEILPDAKLTKAELFPANVRDMSKPLAVKLTVTFPEKEIAGNRPELVTMPRGAMVLGMMNSFFTGTSLKKRRFPLRVMPRAIKETITMEANSKFRYELPLPIDRREEGLFRMQRKTVLEAGKITEEFFFALDSMLVSPQNYGKLRNAAVALRDISRTLPVAAPQAVYSTDGANVEVLKSSRHYNIIDDNSWEYTVNSVFRILNYAGMKEHSNIILAYVESHGKPEIKGSVTDSKGKTHQISAKDIQYMDDEKTASAPRYAKRKLAVVTLPGVDINSTVDLTVSGKFRNEPGFFTQMLTRGNTPVRESELVIEHPAKMKLNISDIPAEINDSATFGGKRIIRRYTMGNSPRMPDEPGQPEFSLFVPALTISTVDAGKLAVFHTQAAQKQVDTASAEIAELAKKITAGKKSAAEKAEAVEKYVYKHIRKIDLPLKSMIPADYSAPQVTLRDGYGNSFDRAVLMAAMLKALGIKYEFIPVTDELYTVEKNDQLLKFPENNGSEMLLKIRKNDSVCYLNDSGLYAPAGTVKHDGYMQLNHNYEILSVPDNAGKDWDFSLKLNADLSADLTVKYYPRTVYLEKLREQFAGFTPQTEKQFFEKYAASIAPQAEISESKFDGEKLILRLHIPHFAQRSGRFISLPLPGFKMLAADLSIPAKKRQTPYFNESNISINMDYEISVPENFRLIQPEELVINVHNVCFFDNYIFFNGKHLFSFMFNSLPGIFNPGAFEHLRGIKNKINDFSTGNILFTAE